MWICVPQENTGSAIEDDSCFVQHKYRCALKNNGTTLQHNQHTLSLFCLRLSKVHRTIKKTTSLYQALSSTDNTRIKLISLIEVLLVKNRVKSRDVITS